MLRRESHGVFHTYRRKPKMRSLRPFAAILLALSLAACAAQSQPDLTPPPKKPLDAKTQLETGRKY
jgi:predicted small lipoprotein YifL